MIRLLFELIKQDAVYMEIEHFNTPWSPNFSDFSESFLSFRNELATTFSADFFCSFALEIPESYKTENPETTKLIAYHSDKAFRYIFFKDSPKFEDFPLFNIEIIESDLEATELLCNEINSLQESALSKAFNNWKFNNPNSKTIFAPYIVRYHDEIGEWRNDYKPRKIYEMLTENERLDEFLYTKSEIIGGDFQCVKPDNWYLFATYIIGIPNPSKFDLKDLISTIETATISFQLSWGYPELVNERQKTAKEMALREQSEIQASKHRRRSEKNQQAIKVAEDIMKPVQDAYFRAREFINIIIPSDTQLIMKYRSPRYYFVDGADNDDNGVVVHENPNWVFRHQWTVKDINLNPEGFRAQLSCSMVSFKGDKSSELSIHEKWKEGFPLPWFQLLSLSPKILEVYQFMFGSTFQKIITISEFDFNKLNWNSEDTKAFDILKGCFHYPFKKFEQTNDYIVTGPLLILWALEFGGIKSVGLETYSLLTENRHITGNGWMDFDFLVGLHGIFYKFKDDCEINVYATREGRTLSVNIILSKCREIDWFPNQVDKVKKIVKDGSSTENKIDYNRGGLEASISRILERINNKTDIFCDVPNGILEISFEVSEF